MADSDYKIKYDASSALTAAQQIDVLTKAFIALNAEVEKAKKNKVNFAGLGASATAATPKLIAMNATMKDIAATGTVLSNSLATVKGSLGNVRASSSLTTNSLQSLFSASKLLSTSVSFVQAFDDAMEHARDFSRETAEQVAKLRDNTRELKSMLGGGAGDDKPMLDVLKLSVQTGADVVKATNFAERFQGAMPRGEDKGNITPETKDLFRAESLRTAMRLGVNPSVMGKFAGSVAGYQKVPTVESGMDQTAGALWGMEKGRDSYDQHIKAFEKLAPIMVKGKGGGGIRNVAEAGVILGAVDPIAGSADQAQNMIIQSNRLLSRTNGKQGEWLKSKGVRPDMDWDEKMAKIAPFIQGPGGEKVLEDLGFNQMLGDMGFNQQRQREVTIAIAKELPIIQKRLAESRSTKFGAEAIAKNDEHAQNDPASRGMAAKSRLASAKLIRGMQGAVWQDALVEAEAQLQTPDANGNTGIDNSATAATDSLLAWTTWRKTADVRSDRIRTKAINNLVSGFQAQGVSFSQIVERYPGMQEFESEYSPEKQEQQYGRAAADYKKMTGKSIGGTGSKAVEDKLDQLIDINKQQLKEQQQVRRGERAPGKDAVKPGRP
jgi:hypothetical protein